MNENPPPLPPPKDSPPPLTRGQAFGIGLLLFVGSSLLCLLNPIFGFFGFAAAITCLFFKDFRHIFTGYILALGVTLLVAVVACFSIIMLSNINH
jgi:peptidoglycan/LPS O-acetylase OafA/YrhL